ncbi:2-hydroxyacid dehydrogenase [Brevibacillus parabrevis]|uniref:Oxidoreductase n=1 Tax=Brevibacillus parabrevis TaxID=54914 RepID=A0A4Y3PAM0_BREPA|nr:2-hydroxyacid dehydrogenase [Brevibacillus parabrevis]RNB93613.1 oxidoreductase [Brevibacillus parabrevis]WDV97495.1 2-hydroxyacid dehydrogenase [Brevibacillus parabrevis]GEB31560.1 oxidoreductase [Brevibacillus parabrevis]
MKVLAIADRFIPSREMGEGLQELEKLGFQVEVREWQHNSLEELQKDNLAVELHGPEAVTMPDSVFAGIEQYDVLVVQFAPVSAKVIAAASKLKVIGILRGGTENVAIEAAKERGVSVLNTPGRNARAVAEFTLGLILSEVRNIARSHAALKQAEWRKSFPNSEAIPELFAKKVGLIGYGNVGQLIAGFLTAMGCEILVYDEYIEQVPAPYRKVALDELLQQADIVSLHLRLTEKTQHFIGEHELAQMKPNAVLINTARSGLIDEKALVAYLQAGRIAGAALDVFDNEPLAADDPLLHLDNVTITPHMAGSTRDAFTNSPKQMAGYLANIVRKEGNVPVVNEVLPQL